MNLIVSLMMLPALISAWESPGREPARHASLGTPAVYVLPGPRQADPAPSHRPPWLRWRAFDI